jgi:sphinganine-1-phosphate aldolase
MAGIKFPEKGISKEELFSFLDEVKKADGDWRNGKIFSLIYNPGDDLVPIADEAYKRFLNENFLNPLTFPSLLKMEQEVVSMVADLIGGGEDVAGNMSSGGTESIMLVVKAARDYARVKFPGIKNPQLVLPLSAHPAFHKAAHYLGIKTVMVPLDNDYKADIKFLEQAINENTILVVGSAPSYPHGIIDPISEMSEIAQTKNVWFHVDMCLGGFVLPFVKKLGHELPAYNFSNRGVNSISADIHKYGYIPKGASVILYRNAELRSFQYYCYADWPGGIYATPTIMGARSGGAIASSYVVIKYLGLEGYLALMKKAIEATSSLIKGVNSINGLNVLGKPQATVFAFGSADVDIYFLAYELQSKGWYLDSQQFPPSLHMTVSPVHTMIIGQFLEDLSVCTHKVKVSPKDEMPVMASLFEQLASMDDRKMANNYIIEYMNQLYRYHQ